MPCLLDITLASINGKLCFQLMMKLFLTLVFAIETNSKRRKTLTPVKDAELEKHGQDASNLVTDVMSSVFGKSFLIFLFALFDLNLKLQALLTMLLMIA